MTKGLTSTSTMKMLGMENEGGKVTLNPKVKVVLKNGKKNVKELEYLFSKFDKLSNELNLAKFLKTNNQYLMTKQTDKKNIRRNLFRRMFPTEQFDKRWTMIIIMPKRRKRKNSSLIDDDNLSLLSGGTGSVISGMETLLGGGGESITVDD